MVLRWAGRHCEVPADGSKLGISTLGCNTAARGLGPRTSTTKGMSLRP